MDTHIRKDATFEWVVKIFGSCREIYNKFNWGKNHELLIETCKEIEQNMAQLVTFQTTRFANSIRFVVINLRADYEAVILCLQKIQENYANSSDAKDQEKRNDATRLLNAIRNKRFCIHLSGIADVYDVFGTLVNIVQQVNILPHERYDNFIKVLDKMFRMISQVDDTCIGEKCVWPRYHADKNEMVKNGTYQNVEIEKDSNTSMYQTRFAVAQLSIDVQMDPIQQCQDNIVILLTRLEKDLRNEVFESSTVDLIEKIRFITDLHSLAKDVVKRGRVIVSAVNANKFVEYTRFITSTLAAWRHMWKREI